MSHSRYRKSNNKSSCFESAIGQQLSGPKILSINLRATSNKPSHKPSINHEIYLITWELSIDLELQTSNKPKYRMSSPIRFIEIPPSPQSPIGGPIRHPDKADRVTISTSRWGRRSSWGWHQSCRCAKGTLFGQGKIGFYRGSMGFYSGSIVVL